MTLQQTIIIFDGDCRFFQASLKWLQKSLLVEAQAFQKANLAQYSLTRPECEKEVIAINNSVIYRGAKAVAMLLKLRGNPILAKIFDSKMGDSGYRWVAAHRNSLPIKTLTLILERIS